MIPRHAPRPFDRVDRCHQTLRASMVAALLLLQSGCAALTDHFGAPAAAKASTIPAIESVPAWALASTRGQDADSIVGIGSGDSLDQATRFALSDVAARLSVSVESQLRDVYREVDGTSTATLEHAIETRVLSTRLNSWERTRSARVADVFWVEVQVDRGRLVRDSLLELHDTASDVDRQLKAAAGSAFARVSALHVTASDRDRISNLIALVDALDPSFDRSEWDRHRERWRTLEASARRALVFEVRSDPASQEIARWLESELSAERFSAQPGDCARLDIVCIDIRSEVVEADVASRYVARIRSFFSVLEPGGGLVREVDLRGRGNSTADPIRARRRALEDLRANFESASILDRLIDSRTH